MSSDVIRAVALRRAKTKTRIPAWDLRLVLEFLTSRSFEPLESCSLRNLTQKTVFLVMLASGRRASEIHALSGILSDVSRERDRSFRLKFLPEFLAKNQPPEEPSPSIQIRPLSLIAGPEDADVRLCPVRALKVYLNRTKTRRNGQLRRLFVPVNESRHRDIVKTTLSRWVSALIKSAYADLASEPRAGASEHLTDRPLGRGGGALTLPLSQARTHEVRAWSASIAAANSVRLDEILQAAYWRSTNVFVDFYLRDVSSVRLDGLHTLSAVVTSGHSCRI